MNKEQKRIKKLMDNDPLSTAEKITGKDYKTDKGTESLGFLLHIERNRLLTQELNKQDDTTLSEKTPDYVRKIEAFGFVKVYEEPFLQDGGEPESIHVFFLKELGIIICFDTHWGNINGGDIYYNWSPDPKSKGFRGYLTSTGGYYFPDKKEHIGLFEKDLTTPYKIPNYPESVKWTSDSEDYESFRTRSDAKYKEQHELIELSLSCGKRQLWVGSHDCRVGVKNIIKSLYENGKFFPIWQESPFPWLTHYKEKITCDKKDYTALFKEYEQITIDRINKMPDDVKACFNNTYPKRRNQQ